MVIGVDWSDEAFAAVQQALLLYRPTEVTIVHGIDLGLFEYPALAQVGGLQGYEGFRWAVTAAGEALLERTAMTVYPACPSVKQVNETGNPARVILHAVQEAKADILVVGARGRSRLAEAVLGSVSHRVLMHSPCTTLVVRGGSRPVKRVLVAVEGKEDGGRIVQWLKEHPFKDFVELCILSVVVPLGIDEPYLAAQWESWSAMAKANADELVKSVAASLLSPAYTVRTRVAIGNAPATIASESEGMDLVVASSHGRHGLDRFLLCSVSHSLVHHVSAPILIVH
jgi:nucleotide-binding universal stress UspA family protein